MTDVTRSGNPFTWMLDVGTAIVAPVDLDVAMDNAARRIGEAMDVSQVNIHSYDREADTLRSEAAWQAGGTLDDFVVGRLQTEFKVSQRPSWRPTLEGHIEEWHITDPDLPQEDDDDRQEAEGRQFQESRRVVSDPEIHAEPVREPLDEPCHEQDDRRYGEHSGHDTAHLVDVHAVPLEDAGAHAEQEYGVAERTAIAPRPPSGSTAEPRRSPRHLRRLLTHPNPS